MTTTPEAVRSLLLVQGPWSAHVCRLAAPRAARTHFADVPPVVFTIGYSTRTVQDFIDLLKAHGIERLVDIRRVPRSRHNRPFNRRLLRHSLEAAGIAYVNMAGLGGFRRSNAKSSNGAWRKASFRDYADHMQADEFTENLASLVELSASQRIALMCAEAVSWRCHRSLIADALVLRGIRVMEILKVTQTPVHGLTAFARVDDAAITGLPKESLQVGDQSHSSKPVWARSGELTGELQRVDAQAD